MTAERRPQTSVTVDQATGLLCLTAVDPETGGSFVRVLDRDEALRFAETLAATARRAGEGERIGLDAVAREAGLI